MLGYFVCSSWCGVEVRINGSGSEDGVLGVSPPGLWFEGGRCGSYFLAGWCLVGVVGVYSCCAIGSVEYRQLIHLGRNPFDIELY